MAYTYTQLKSDVNDMVHLKLGSVGNVRNLLNRSVREVNDDLDLRGTKRRVRIPTGFFDGILEVPLPSDLKGEGIIDLAVLRGRSWVQDWTKVTAEELRRRSETESYLFAIAQDQQLRKMLVNTFGDSSRATLHAMESVTANGTWAESGDADNLEAETWNYLTGSGALRFDSNASATSLILTNSTMTAIDLSTYADISEMFVALFIPSETAAAAISSIALRWGSSSSVYYEKSETTDHAGNAFVAGWNIVSFDWLTSTPTGTPTDTAIDYTRIAITTSSLAAQNDWRVDSIVAIKGDLHNIDYYSKNYWKASDGTFLNSSTADTDVLLVDEDEQSLVLTRAAWNAARILRESTDAKDYMEEYKEQKKQHQINYKSERKPLTETYHDFQTH